MGDRGVGDDDMHGVEVVEHAVADMLDRGGVAHVELIGLAARRRATPRAACDHGVGRVAALAIGERDVVAVPRGGERPRRRRCRASRR